MAGTTATQSNISRYQGFLGTDSTLTPLGERFAAFSCGLFVHEVTPPHLFAGRDALSHPFRRHHGDAFFPGLSHTLCLPDHGRLGSDDARHPLVYLGRGLCSRFAAKLDQIVVGVFGAVVRSGFVPQSVSS